MLKIIPYAGLFTAAVLSQASLAEIFTYEDLNADTRGTLGDQLNSVSASFDDISNRFTWDVEFNSGSDVDGFWLVVNNGSTPKTTDVNELAIMYGDLNNGILSTYAYNGQNGADSIFSPSTRLQTDFFTVSTNGFSIDIDATAINSYTGWDTPSSGDINGIGFDNDFGALFNVAVGSKFAYEDIHISSFNFPQAQQSLYDISNPAPIDVPEPSSLLLLGLGLAGLVVSRKRQA